MDVPACRCAPAPATAMRGQRGNVAERVGDCRAPVAGRGGGHLVIARVRTVQGYCRTVPRRTGKPTGELGGLATRYSSRHRGAAGDHMGVEAFGIEKEFLRDLLAQVDKG